MARKKVQKLKIKRKKPYVYTVTLERDEDNKCKLTKDKESIFVKCDPKIKLPIALKLPTTDRWPPDPDILDTFNFNANKAKITALKTVPKSRQYPSKNHKKISKIFGLPFINLNSKH